MLALGTEGGRIILWEVRGHCIYYLCRKEYTETFRVLVDMYGKASGNHGGSSAACDLSCC